MPRRKNLGGRAPGDLPGSYFSANKSWTDNPPRNFTFALAPLKNLCVCGMERIIFSSPVFAKVNDFVTDDVIDEQIRSLVTR